MPEIHAQTPDGVTHSFPDNTPPEVMDRVMKEYVTGKKEAAPVASKPAMAPGSYQTGPGKPVLNVKDAPPPKTIGDRVGDFARSAEDQLPVAGMIAGGILGSVEPGPGNFIGAGLGGALGEQARRLIKGESTASIDAAKSTGLEAMHGVEGEMGAQIIGKGLEVASPILKRAISRPSVKSAQNLFERGVVPNGMSAEDQEAMRENFQRASKYIAPETKDYPITKGEGGTMRTAGIAHRAGDNLWKNTVEPVQEMFGDVQRPGDTVADGIRNVFTERDKLTRPHVVAAADRLADSYAGRPITVSEMGTKVKELNADKAVSRYYDMSPNEQVQAESADPSLRGKLAELETLRHNMFDAISDTGGDKLGKQFAEARKDWGALRSIEDQMRGTKVPTPQPLFKRTANTAKGIVSLKNGDIARGSDTLFDLNNPNRLLPKSFNTLGQTGLEPPTLDITAGRTMPPGPYGNSRQLPAVGETSPPNPAAVAGVRDPSFDGAGPRNEQTYPGIPPIELGPSSLPQPLARVPGRPYESPTVPLVTPLAPDASGPVDLGTPQSVPYVAKPQLALPPAPVITPAPADLSGPTDLPVSLEPGTRASRQGRLLPPGAPDRPGTIITPQPENSGPGPGQGLAERVAPHREPNTGQMTRTYGSGTDAASQQASESLVKTVPATGTSNGPGPAGLSGEPREIMRQSVKPSRVMPKGGSSALPEASFPPELKAEIEKQAGRSLTDEEAIDWDWHNRTIPGAAEASPGDTNDIRAQHREGLEKPDPSRYAPKQIVTGTDSLGRYAEGPNKVKMYPPKNMDDADIENWAKNKWQEQLDMQKAIKDKSK